MMIKHTESDVAELTRIFVQDLQGSPHSGEAAAKAVCAHLPPRFPHFYRMRKAEMGKQKKRVGSCTLPVIS